MYMCRISYKRACKVVVVWGKVAQLSFIAQKNKKQHSHREDNCWPQWYESDFHDFPTFEFSLTHLIDSIDVSLHKSCDFRTWKQIPGYVPEIDKNYPEIFWEVLKKNFIWTLFFKL